MLFSSVAKKVTRTSETVVRYVVDQRHHRIRGRRRPQIKRKEKEMQTERAKGLTSQSISVIGERWNTPQLPWLHLEVTLTRLMRHGEPRGRSGRRSRTQRNRPEYGVLFAG